MKYNTLTFLGLAASAVAIPVSDDLTPKGSAPDGCSVSRDGTFEVSIYKEPGTKRSVEKRSCDGNGVLVLSLEDGVLKDAQGRTGYIASNYQFQFDAPPQADSIYTAGWSTCSNGSLALGSGTTFYQCLSGDFYNLYDRSWADQCEPVEIIAYSCEGSTDSGGQVTQIPDGQVGGSGVTDVPAVTQITDGQIQAPTNVVTQISDGQIQVPPSAPVAPPITQISDGQIQAPTETAPGAPVTQISDGQIQAPTDTAPGAPVTQISDGQIQAPTDTAPAAPVTQISDGQIQAPTNTAPVAPITQISDGQIQAPTGTPTAVITQITDGQIQAPTPVGNSTVPTTTAVVPLSAGNKVVPGTTAALLAFAGAYLCL